MQLSLCTDVFWHQHKDANCKIPRIPKSNQEYWLPKLQRNTSRDKENKTKLRKMGWRVFVIWECEISNREYLIKMIKTSLDSSITLNKS